MGSNAQFQMIGFLGKHGPYTFYKSIKVGDRTVSLSSFMPVKIWPDSAILSIADVQLLYSDKTESFCSLKLYFLPENTPDGRLQQHGEDEVISLQDKVVIRASDLLTWLVDESDWDWGFKTPASTPSEFLSTTLSKSFVTDPFIKTDKQKGFTSEEVSKQVVVLNYERYIRLRTILKRLEGSADLSNWLSHPLVLAIGGLKIGPNCHILYTKEVFDYPELEDHELLCNHLAPKVKGRPRKKKSRHPSQGSVSNASDSSSSSVGSDKAKRERKPLNGMTAHPKVEIGAKSGVLQTKLGTNKKPSSSNLKSSHVIEASSNGLQILKIEPQSWAKIGDISSGTKRTHHQANGFPRNADVSTESGKHQSGTLSVECKTENENLWDSHGAAQLLGPALTELAQKLEKSNALQILPIRPTVIKKQDMDADNHVGRKKRKTEINSSAAAGPAFEKTGPYSFRTSVVGPPEIERNIKGGSSASRNNLSDIAANILPKKLIAAHLSSQPTPPAVLLEHIWQPMETGPVPAGVSPCSFISTRQIYGDPYEIKKCVLNSVPRSSDGNKILDFSVKRSRRDRESANQAKVKVKVNLNVELQPELLDLSAKGQSQSTNNIFHNLADIPPPNAMNQRGLRLTSEVTLFPSQNLIPINHVKESNMNQRKSSNISNNASSTVTKSQKNTSSQSWRGHAQQQQSQSASSSSLHTSSRIGGKESGFHGHSQKKRTEPSTSERLSNPGQHQSSHSNSAAGSSRERAARDQQTRDQQARDQQMMNPMVSPYIHPAYYGKIDPTYLSLMGAQQMFLPPSGLVTMPNAVEQFYKDLIMQSHQGMPPTFPNWFPPSGNDRGSKS